MIEHNSQVIFVIMRSPNSSSGMWFGTCTMLLLMATVWVANTVGYLTSVRMALQNVMSPARLAVAAIGSLPAGSSATAEPDFTDSEVVELQNALLENELQRRQLLIENARLHNELRSTKRMAAIEAVSSQDLVDFVAVKAKILSHAGLSDSLREAFIDAGKAQGLQRSQLVVSGAGLVLDKGTDQGIAAGQKVAHGTAVVGRISKVSQWVGLVQPITAEDFSAAVQIVKLAPQGASYGAKGLLEGTGTGGCRVTAIPYTESVAVGDEVFSADIDGVQGPRLYYGRVVHAEFSAGGEWDVRVEPAFQADTLQEVAVVQQRLNAARTGVARQ